MNQLATVRKSLMESGTMDPFPTVLYIVLAVLAPEPPVLEAEPLTDPCSCMESRQDVLRMEEVALLSENPTDQFRMYSRAFCDWTCDCCSALLCSCSVPDVSRTIDSIFAPGPSPSSPSPLPVHTHSFIQYLYRNRSGKAEQRAALGHTNIQFQVQVP